jgi:hypothetical protein
MPKIFGQISKLFSIYKVPAIMEHNKIPKMPKKFKHWDFSDAQLFRVEMKINQHL